MGRRRRTSAVKSHPFQSTHPVWDGTMQGRMSITADVISIHPSRVGWDARSNISTQPSRNFNPPIPCGMGLNHQHRRVRKRDFNPPIPCGMGLSMWRIFATWTIFQSTHPVWDGTTFRGAMGHVSVISIHPSRVGWDCDHISLTGAYLISIHPSRVGWDEQRASGRRGRRISIHPSRVGWDVSIRDVAHVNVLFQSTHPVWDGTRSRSESCCAA